MQKLEIAFLGLSLSTKKGKRFHFCTDVGMSNHFGKLSSKNNAILINFNSEVHVQIMCFYNPAERSNSMICFTVYNISAEYFSNVLEFD